MLAGAVNLTHLHLDCKIAWGGPRKVARQLYRDGFHWLEAVGAAKGKFDAAIELLEISESNLSRFVSVRENDLSPNDWVEQFDAELRKLLREK